MIVGNWKMHLNTHEASLLVKRLDDHIPVHRDIEVVLAPSMLSLQPLSVQVDRRKFRLAAQNAFYKDEGAYTGEVSFTMLRDLVHYVLVGHSERRIYFDETLETVRDKVQAAVRNGISPILCVGETRHERAAGETRRVIHDQVTTALSNLTEEEVKDVVIAYEPVWAIGSGLTPTPADVGRLHGAIREDLSQLLGETEGDAVRILYGGSVKPANAAELLFVPNVNGALVGGASLRASDFYEILSAYCDLKAT